MKLKIINNIHVMTYPDELFSRLSSFSNILTSTKQKVYISLVKMIFYRHEGPFSNHEGFPFLLKKKKKTGEDARCCFHSYTKAILTSTKQKFLIISLVKIIFYRHEDASQIIMVSHFY